MTKKMQKVFIVSFTVVVATLFFSSSTRGQGTSLEKRVDALEAQVKTLEQRVDQLESVVKVSGPQKNVAIATAGTLTLQGGTRVWVRGAGIYLNVSDQPDNVSNAPAAVAFKGSTVLCGPPPAPCKVTGGSPNVFVSSGK